MKSISVAFAVLSGVCASVAHGDLWVAPTGSDSNAGTQGAPFRSVQAAVDAAPAEGCVIHLAEGSYFVTAGTTPSEMLTVGKPVRIVADGARANTVLDAEKKRRAVWINCEGAELSGVTVRNGYFQNWNYFGGVRISAGTVSNCIIEANYSYNNDGAWLDGDKAVLTDSIVRNNTSGTNPNGMGITVNKGLVERCEVYGHSRTTVHSSSGAGMYVKGGTVRDCTIHDNFYGLPGYTNNRSPSTANSAAGIWVSGGYVTGCRIYRNGCTGYGGAVRVSGGTFANSLVYDNATTNMYSTATATSYAGGAVYVSGGSMTNCVITGNSAQRLVGGVHQVGGTVKDCIVFGNEIDDFYRTAGTAENVRTDNPGFRDAIAGDYTLPAEDAFGCTFTQDVKVVCGDAGGTVKFFALASNAPGAATYAWDFGDGAVGAGETVEHTYAPGIWSGRLAVAAGGGTVACSAKAGVWASPDTVGVYKTLPEGAEERVVTTDIYAALRLRPRVIELHEGTYDVAKSPIWLTWPVTMRGVDGRDNVVIDAGTANYTRCLVVGDPEARGENVKLYRGDTGDSWSTGAGAIIYSGTVSNCWFHLNRSYYSPAFGLFGGQVLDSLVTGYQEGGGTSSAAACEVANGTMSGCTVTAGTGASVVGSKVGGTVYVHGANAVVTNCLIHGNNMGGAAKENFGGGVYLTDVLVANCVMPENVAAKTGGGVYISGGTLRNCLVAGNSIDNSSGSSGGGVYQTGGSVENCTVVRNTATVSGGGLYQTGGSAVNSIFFYNEGGNVTASGSVTYSGMPAPAVAGEGNTSAEPAFLNAAANDWRFTSLAEAYIDKATPLGWMHGAVDLGGEDRIFGEGPDIGAYEYKPSADEPFIVSFSTQTTSGGLPLACAFVASVSKYDPSGCTFIWNFGDGSDAQSGVGLAETSHEYTSAGGFSVTLTVIPPTGSPDAPAELAREGYVTVIPQVCYVSPDGANKFPYESWANAANNLPDAVAVGSARVVVTNGTYSFDAVNLSRPVTVVSLEGPEKTILKSSARGYNLMTVNDSGAWLEGFTLRDANIADWLETTGGSGLRILAGTVTNCIVRNCSKYSYASTSVGGAGRLYDSRIINNSSGAVSALGAGLYVAGGGFVSGCVVSNNTMVLNSADDINGGAGLSMSGGTVTGCLFADNRFSMDQSHAAGANIRGGLVTHCVFSNNYSRGAVGGVQISAGTIRNCLIVGNESVGGATGDGVGGILVKGTAVAESLTVVGNKSALPGAGVRQTAGTLLNTIVFGNTGAAELDVTGGTQSHCFTATALPDGAVDCLTGDPLFADADNGDYTLRPLSMAKDNGILQAWMTGAKDLAGSDRVQGDVPDIGAYEVDASIVMPFTATVQVGAGEKLSDGSSRITLTALYGGNTGAVTFSWKFGDAEGEEWAVTDVAETTHVFAPGAYTVQLKAYDAGKEEWTEVDQATAIAYPDTCYVAQGEGVTPKFPYVRPEEGAATVKEALSVGCDEIVVCPGTYTLSEVVNIGRKVTLRGATSDREASVLYAPSTDGLRVMNLNHTEAIVSGIKLKGGRMTESSNGGAVLNLTAGMVTNCVMEGGWNYYNSSVLVKNGTIVDSVIRNATAGHSTQEASGVTLYEGALVDRCVITNCSTSATWDSTWGEAVCMADATAVLKNSLIAYNTGHRVGGVRIRAAREFSNCTIVSNVARKACGGVQTDNGANRPQTCVNNIVWGNLAPTNPNLDDVLIFSYSCGVELVGGTGNVTSDPKFRNPSRGDWRLRASSPCENAGFNAYLSPGDRDLLGSPRLRNVTVDMGCYECQGGGFSLLVR